MRKLTTALIAGVLLVGLLGPAGAKPAHVWHDNTGDADLDQGLGASIPAGFDLAHGTLARKKANIEFAVTHADMPPSGSFPEGARFLWAFSVGKADYRITAKSADIGKPDLLAGQTDERVGRVDATGHFRLEGDCGTEAVVASLSAVNCKPLAYLEGTWDPANKTFTVTVPMKAIKAKPRTVIKPGGGDAVGICQICWVSHAAERSLDATIIDAASMTKSWRIPKKG